ncbi:hypothetical protein AU375_02598 [Methylobacterium radiotolerans]|nr:hypothetical protein AU375_02598 [Methylobacterium radiotolerans]
MPRAVSWHKATDRRRCGAAHSRRAETRASETSRRRGPGAGSRGRTHRRPPAGRGRSSPSRARLRCASWGWMATRGTCRPFPGTPRAARLVRRPRGMRSEPIHAGPSASRRERRSARHPGSWPGPPRTRPRPGGTRWPSRSVARWLDRTTVPDATTPPGRNGGALPARFGMRGRNSWPPAHRSRAAPHRPARAGRLPAWPPGCAAVAADRGQTQMSGTSKPPRSRRPARWTAWGARLGTGALAFRRQRPVRAGLSPAQPSATGDAGRR